MRLNILIGGKAGQGINKVSNIVSKTLREHGYYIFNYRDYPSIIRGGHNFNILSVADFPIESHESKIDGIIALDENTLQVHKNELKKNHFSIDYSKFFSLGINLNIALSGALMKVLGLDKRSLDEEIKTSLAKKGEEAIKKALDAAQKGFDSQTQKFSLKKLKNNISILSGSQAVAQGAINSGIDVYVAYPMTPATNALHELARRQLDHNYLVFQPENEIAVVNIALGASFAGARVMVGTSGGGFDLMGESLSFQGISKIPLTVYLASRVGPGTGIPTYTMQGDLDIALRSGHGEFPRVVIAPANPTEVIEKTNEAMYLSNKFNCLSILLSDKHVAESEFSSSLKPKKPLKVDVTRTVPGEAIIKASSYETDEFGLTTESATLAIKNANERLERYKKIKTECKKFAMLKFHGKPTSKNLIIGWGAPSGAIKDAIRGLDAKFMQVMYMKPLSEDIKKELQKAKRVLLIEANLTGQLGRLIREKTGIKIENRILKYDGRPFTSDTLKEQIVRWLK